MTTWLTDLRPAECRGDLVGTLLPEGLPSVRCLRSNQAIPMKFTHSTSKRPRPSTLSVGQGNRTVEQKVHQGRGRLHASLSFLFSMLGSVQNRLDNRDGDVSEGDRDLCIQAMDALRKTMHQVCGNKSDLPEIEKRALADEVAAQIKPGIRSAGVGGRMLNKPRGYAGDYLTIDQMYAEVPYGDGAMARLFDTFLLCATPSKAVRNRRGLLQEIIQETVRNRQGQTARVMSIACGPAREVSDVFANVPSADCLQVELLDVDEQAVLSTGRRMQSEGLDGNVRMTQGNALRLRGMKHLGEHDLIYSIGLIDYFEDKAVVRMLDQVYDKLAPGGRVVLGNFHADNPWKVFMDHALEWELIHRSEADMHRLFQSSRFGRRCTQIRYEETGINLFAEGTKGC